MSNEEKLQRALELLEELGVSEYLLKYIEDTMKIKLNKGGH